MSKVKVKLKASGPEGGNKDYHVSFDITDYDGSIRAMLLYIAEQARSGHSFPVIVDPVYNPDGSYRDGKIFGIDGDGSSKIWTINCEPLKESEETYYKMGTDKCHLGLGWMKELTM